MAADLPSALEVIQQTIVSAPHLILSLQPVKPEDAITIQDVRSFVLVKGALKDRSLVRNIHLLIGFYAQRDIVFKAVYGKMECDFDMKAGTFYFAFDKKSMIPVTAMVFADIRLVSDDIGDLNDAIIIVGALLQPKLRYALVLNPSTWGGAGRTALVKDGSIRF